MAVVHSEEKMVGVRGFEPPTPASRTQYSTRLSYTPIAAASDELRSENRGARAAVLEPLTDRYRMKQRVRIG